MNKQLNKKESETEFKYIPNNEKEEIEENVSRNQEESKHEEGIMEDQKDRNDLEAELGELGEQNPSFEHYNIPEIRDGTYNYNSEFGQH